MGDCRKKNIVRWKLMNKNYNLSEVTGMELEGHNNKILLGESRAYLA